MMKTLIANIVLLRKLVDSCCIGISLMQRIKQHQVEGFYFTRSGDLIYYYYEFLFILLFIREQPRSKTVSSNNHEDWDWSARKKEVLDLMTKVLGLRIKKIWTSTPFVRYILFHLFLL